MTNAYPAKITIGAAYIRLALKTSALKVVSSAAPPPLIRKNPMITTATPAAMRMRFCFSNGNSEDLFSLMTNTIYCCVSG